MTPTSHSNQLPRWDLSNVFPGLESEDLRLAVEQLKTLLNDLDNYLDKHAISQAGPVPEESEKLANIIGLYLEKANAVAELNRTLVAYVYSFVTTDSYNTTAKHLLSQLEILGVRLQQQEVRFRGWLSAFSEHGGALEAALELDETVKLHAFYLKETAEQSRYQMAEEQEKLAAELNLSGGSAWAKLQGTVASQVKAPFERNGKVEELPITIIQTFYNDPDGQIRRQAYNVEMKAWETWREPLAASFNGVKGTVVTLNKHRGRRDALHSALDQNRIDTKTVEALLSAMKASFPAFRRYWRRKAERLGKEQLPWWDLWAPVGRQERRYTFDEARDFIIEQFSTFSYRLADLARRAFDNQWIDAEPRDGKRGGAFCMLVPAVEESRILCNFDGSFDQVATLAHELGHAYHNHCLAGKTQLQRRTPMTLAETASIFNQTIITDAVLSKVNNVDEELSILESFLIDSSQVIVDIYSRYLFEKDVFERRADAELSADDFCQLMVSCQQETYGDGLDNQSLHPYMWAWKPHYYSTNRSFYNFPYAFGLLFGLGLYNIYQKGGPDFVTAYDDLLSSTGEGTAAELAGRFGIDLRDIDFWLEGIQVIERRIDRYLAL